MSVSGTLQSGEKLPKADRASTTQRSTYVGAQWHALEGEFNARRSQPIPIAGIPARSGGFLQHRRLAEIRKRGRILLNRRCSQIRIGTASRTTRGSLYRTILLF